MIINEISVMSVENGQEEFDSIMSDFLSVCHKIATVKKDLDFFCTQELYLEEVAPGYTLYSWLDNPKVPKREKDLFRRFISKRQLLDKNQFLTSEFIIELPNGMSANAVGCLAAYETEGYVVSIRTAPIWEQEEIKGSYISIEEDDRAAVVRNCSLPEHVDNLVTEERQKNFRMVSSAKELWEKRESIYQHLLFCDCVFEQLLEARNLLHIKMIMKKLQILEDYFKDYNGKFEKDKVGFGCREESESVKNNGKLRNMRVFELPDKSKAFFSWHISFPGNYPGRIHFLPDAKKGVGIIGYVGKHLPTKNYPTI